MIGKSKFLQGCKLNFNLRLYVKVMTASTKLKLNLRLSGLEPTIFCESNCPSDGFESRAQSNGAAGSSPVGGVFLIGVVLFLFFFQTRKMFSHSLRVQCSLFLFCQANPLPHGLDKIPDVQGYLVLNSDGAVLAVSVNVAYCLYLAGKSC